MICLAIVFIPYIMFSQEKGKFHFYEHTTDYDVILNFLFRITATSAKKTSFLQKKLWRISLINMHFNVLFLAQRQSIIT